MQVLPSLEEVQVGLVAEHYLVRAVQHPDASRIRFVGIAYLHTVEVGPTVGLYERPA